MLADRAVPGLRTRYLGGEELLALYEYAHVQVRDTSFAVDIDAIGIVEGISIRSGGRRRGSNLFPLGSLGETMAIAVSLTSARRNHQTIPLTMAANSNWQTITFPGWVKRVEIINYGADTMFVHTDVADGASFVSGVEVPSGGSFAFPCGGPDGPYLAVRHASGSYAFGVQMLDGEAA